jgi:hypothetical protein
MNFFEIPVVKRDPTIDFKTMFNKEGADSSDDGSERDFNARIF